jgi:Fic-DOC domain mobile mystery protein B
MPDDFSAARDPADTPLTDEEARDLIPSLSTRGQLNEIERMNIRNARAWIMRPRVLQREDLLTDHFARELHKRMFHQVWKWAGKYRKTEKNLGWEPHRINEGVRILLDDAKAWLEHDTYPLQEAAVRLHHRLVVIHPWPNGNGRHARLIADALVAARGGPPLTWGASAELGTGGELRSRYIAAIKAADAGDFAPIMDFAGSG